MGQRPTLPQLKLKYHWRVFVSRPSSEWYRVGPKSYNHPIISPNNNLTSLRKLDFNSYMFDKIKHTHSNKINQIISIRQLHASQHFHPEPINVVVYNDLNGDTLF